MADHTIEKTPRHLGKQSGGLLATLSMVSDTQQGAGWWLASDGRWYPPNVASTQCWRCGNQRPAGPAWCPTCQAPEMVPPGQHQTFRGPLFVPFPPVVPIVRTAEQKARGRRRWWVGSGLAVAIVGVLAVAAALSPGDGSSPAGTMSAGACLNVVSAARDLSAGSRTLPSFLAVVRAQEGPAREASRMNSRYLPISQAIVSVDEDVSAGQSGAVGLAVLFRECGS